jgi:TPR repeat protein
MSQSRDYDATLLAFQQWWDRPIKDFLFDESKSEPAAYDYQALYQRLCAELVEDQAACETYIKQHENLDTLSQHQLSILGTIYLCQTHHNPQAQQHQYEKAKMCFEAAKHYPWALNCLGFIYDCGQGVSVNYGQAIDYYKQAMQDDSAALNNLGYSYNHGRGVTKDVYQAIKHYEQAATKGNIAALHNLGLLYLNGDGVLRNFSIAVKYFEQAAQKGHPNAIFRLGGRYLNGQGITRDYRKSFHCFVLAANTNVDGAIGSLGHLYRDGDGTAQDFKKALACYKQAIKKGDNFAFINLGDLYRDASDINQAAYCYRQAGEKNVREGYARLGTLNDDHPNNPIVTYHSAILTKRPKDIADLRDTIKTEPQSLVDVAMQDSMQVIRETFENNELTNNFINFIIHAAADKIAPYFDAAFTSIDFPSELVSIILSYIANDSREALTETISELTKLSDDIISSILSYTDEPHHIHSDYVNQAIKICSIAAGKKFPTAPPMQSATAGNYMPRQAFFTPTGKHEVVATNPELAPITPTKR